MNDHDRFVEAAANTAHQRNAARLQAAAAEARELALREALARATHALGNILPARFEDNERRLEIRDAGKAALSAPRDTAALDAMLAKARGDAADCAENHYTAEEGRALEAQVAAERLKAAAAQARIREMRTELEDRGCRREGRGCGLDSSSKLCSTCELIASPDDDDAELRAFGLRVAEAMREVSRKSGWLSHVGPVVESVLRGEGGT